MECLNLEHQTHAYNIFTISSPSLVSHTFFILVPLILSPPGASSLPFPPHLFPPLPSSPFPSPLPSPPLPSPPLPSPILPFSQDVEMHLFEITVHAHDVMPCNTLLMVRGRETGVLAELDNTVVTLRQTVIESSVIATRYTCTCTCTCKHHKSHVHVCAFVYMYIVHCYSICMYVWVCTCTCRYSCTHTCTCRCVSLLCLCVLVYELVFSCASMHNLVYYCSLPSISPFLLPFLHLFLAPFLHLSLLPSLPPSLPPSLSLPVVWMRRGRAVMWRRCWQTLTLRWRPCHWTSMSWSASDMIPSEGGRGKEGGRREREREKGERERRGQ